MLIGYNTSNVNAEVLRKYLKSIGVAGLTAMPKDEMIKTINHKIYNREITKNEIKELLEIWNRQGWKKILFKKFDDNYFNELRSIENCDEIFSKLLVSKSIPNILSFRSDLDVDLHLYNKQMIMNEINEVTFIRLEFVKILQTVETKVDVEPKRVVLPIGIYFDIENSEITIRVQAKDKLESIKSNRTTDVNTAIDIYNYVLNNTKLDGTYTVKQDEKLKETMTTLHNDLTELPESDISRVGEVSDTVDKFINELFLEMGHVEDETYFNYPDVKRNISNIKTKINNVLLYSIVQNFNIADVERIKKSKFAYINLCDATGSNKSKIRQISPCHEPIQATPEYHSIESAFNSDQNSDFVDREQINWFKDANKEFVVQTKVKHIPGFIRIDFKGHAYEEEIQNVLQRIRSYFE